MPACLQNTSCNFSASHKAKPHGIASAALLELTPLCDARGLNSRFICMPPATLLATAPTALPVRLQFPAKPAVASIHGEQGGGLRLTPCSSRAPTAKHQARATVHFIICSAGLAFHRRARLSSNVRPHRTPSRNIAAVKTPSPRNKRLRRRLIALLATCATIALAACTSEQELAVTARLEVSETGTYTLDGALVPKEELKHAVRAKRPQNGKLVLHVVAAPKASFEAVGHAMQAAQFAGAQVGIVGNERF